MKNDKEAKKIAKQEKKEEKKQAKTAAKELFVANVEPELRVVQPNIEEIKMQNQAEQSEPVEQKKGRNVNKPQKEKDSGIPRKALKTLM